MTYNMILTPEQEQRRKDSKQALESLKYNPMCYGCKKLCAGCDGTTKKLWDGCIWYEKANFPSIYALAAYTPELIRNEDPVPGIGTDVVVSMFSYYQIFT